MDNSKKITHINGNAIYPIGDSIKIICNECNVENYWKTNFGLEINDRWEFFKNICDASNNRLLGNVQFIPVENNIIVANMITYDNCDNVGHDSIFRYAAFRVCLATVNDLAYNTNATIHIPCINPNIWNNIEKIIKEVISVDIFIYDQL